MFILIILNFESLFLLIKFPSTLKFLTPLSSNVKSNSYNSKQSFINSFIKS